MFLSKERAREGEDAGIDALIVLYTSRILVVVHVICTRGESNEFVCWKISHSSRIVILTSYSHVN